MKEITCIQQYVIDNLINNKTLSIENLIDAIVKTCSTEQFNNILTILIKTQTSCTNKDKVNFVKMNMYISKEVGNETKIQIIKILRVVLLVYLYVNIGILVALIRQPSRGECVK